MSMITDYDGKCSNLNSQGVFSLYVQAEVRQSGEFPIHLDIKGLDMPYADSQARALECKRFLLRLKPLLIKLYNNLVFEYIPDAKVICELDGVLGVFKIKSNVVVRNHSKQENFKTLLAVVHEQFYHAHISYYEWYDKHFAFTPDSEGDLFYTLDGDDVKMEKVVVLGEHVPF